MLSAPRSLRDRAAQLIFPRLGSNMQPARSAEEDADRVERLLDSVPVGGLVLFHGDRTKTPETLRHLQRASRYPLLIASDLERGSGQQLQGGPVFPHAMAFGACGDRSPAFVHHAAWLTARDAMAAGVHWIFAPVADVHSNPRNPIISTRAYSREPRAAADLTQAFIAGCHEGGALATAKHFPGHGDTETDSHAELPFVSRSRIALENTELIPFRAAIDASVDSVMTAHVVYPALGSKSLPATWSPEILRSLLRDELGFQGVVVSDSLLMAGAGAETAKRVPNLVAAGVDVLLDLEEPELAVDALTNAVRSGKLSEELLDSAFQRVWRMKTGLAARFGDDVFGRPPAAPDAVREAAAFAREVAESSIWEEGEPRVPARASRIHIVIVRPHTDYPDPTQASIESIFAGQFVGAPVYSIGPDDDHVFQSEIGEGDHVVIAAVVKPAAWRAFGLLPRQKQLVHALVGRYSATVCVLGSPDAVGEFAEADYRICSFSDVPSSVEAAASRIARSLNRAGKASSR